jgi:arylsulfatase A-like enzyme
MVVSQTAKNRIRTMLIMAGLLAGPSAGSRSAWAQAVAPAAGGEHSRPSVLILAIDTLRGDHLHCAGNDLVLTPHMDALARDGVRFARCFSTAPWTLPSFASIYTGLLPYRHGAVGGDYAHLDESFTTIAEYLGEAGYRAMGLVSINYLMPSFGMAQGFNTRIPFDPNDDADDQATRISDLGCRFLEIHGQEPFYLFLHYFDVHAPYEPPAPYDRMYFPDNPHGSGVPILPLLLSDLNRAPNKDSGIYDWLAGVTNMTFPMRQYAAEVSYVDYQVGRVIARLQELGLYEDTLVILLADHGEHLGEHRIYFTHWLPYQETLHVPLLVKLPGSREAGRVVEEPVSTLDVLPTVLELTRLSPRTRLDGRSLVGLLQGQPRGDASLLVAEQGASRDSFVKTVIEWPWKLLLFREGERARWELYDLARDPGELNNRKGQEPQVTARLQQRLDSLFPPECPLVEQERLRPVDLDPAARQKLRALGY